MTCQCTADSGCGVSREAIPDAFERVLAGPGSKYGARQALRFGFETRETRQVWV